MAQTNLGGELAFHRQGLCALHVTICNNCSSSQTEYEYHFYEFKLNRNKLSTCHIKLKHNYYIWLILQKYITYYHLNI